MGLRSRGDDNWGELVPSGPSTWRLVNGLLVDERKIWLGVVKNGR